MSKAFTKESDEEGAPDLPEREISPFPNLVTPEGQKRIDADIHRHSNAHALALAGGDRLAAARAARELRYWTHRRNSALVQAPPEDASEVRFGSRVDILREDGRRSSYRIVGEDEADPAKGLLSYVSPLARELMGKGIDEWIEAGATAGKIVAILV